VFREDSLYKGKRLRTTEIVQRTENSQFGIPEGFQAQGRSSRHSIVCASSRRPSRQTHKGRQTPSSKHIEKLRAQLSSPGHFFPTDTTCTVDQIRQRVSWRVEIGSLEIARKSPRAAFQHLRA
jgi:hypothetical protein